MKAVRWGIIGAGRIAHTFARDIGLAGNARLAAVASRSLESAQTFAAQYDIGKAHGSYAELCADDDVDAVYIATPHNLHARQARDAIDAGKAVLCEKPLTDNPGACRDLIEHAAKKNVYLMEAMWTWFLPAVRRARQWVAEGRIGRIRHLKADFGYPLPYDPERREYDSRLAGGCLLEMGVYPVAIADLFLQATPRDISVIAHFAPNGVEDDVAMLMRYDDSTATLATSFRCRLPNSACIVGDDGYIVIPDFFRARECALYRLDERLEHFEDRRESTGFDYEIEAASADILAGRLESATVPTAASLRFQECMAAVKARFPTSSDP